MRIMISGGGTAGHINPGVAIAKEILKHKKDTQIVFVGTKNGMESELIPKEGFDIKFITVKGFKRKLSFDTLSSIKALFKGLLDSRRVIKDFKPDIVIGTGGYVSGPVLLNASLMKIPTIIHEQNAFPGISNKMLARFVDKIVISFEDSRKYLKNENIVLTGNPIRQQIINADRQGCREKLGIKENEKLILCYGGSNGAQKLNDIMLDFVKKGLPQNTKLILGTGKINYDKTIEKAKDIDLKNVEILPYIYNMDEIMAAADLIICRAGAITLGEISTIGLPAIIIPSPNVANNHQEYNARAMKDAGAAEMILEKDLDSIDMGKIITDILNDKDRLAQMKENSLKLSCKDAVGKIYEEVESLMPYMM